MAGFDSELDALFKTSVSKLQYVLKQIIYLKAQAGASKVVSRPAPAPIVAPIAPPNPSSKRKHEKGVSFVDQADSKRSRGETIDPKKKDKKIKKKAPVDSSDEDNDPAVEDSYRQPQSPPRQSTYSAPSPDEGAESESDPDVPPPVHESLVQQSEKPARKRKFVPGDETPGQRDARTIFIGNLPASAANNVSPTLVPRSIVLPNKFPVRAQSTAQTHPNTPSGRSPRRLQTQN
jgi:nucleolar protein 12